MHYVLGVDNEWMNTIIQYNNSESYEWMAGQPTRLAECLHASAAGIVSLYFRRASTATATAA